MRSKKKCAPDNLSDPVILPQTYQTLIFSALENVIVQLVAAGYTISWHKMASCS
jgi:hypothetical protein